MMRFIKATTRWDSFINIVKINVELFDFDIFWD